MDWRSQIAINQRRTAGVLVSFLFLYFFIGWLIASLLYPHPNILSVDQLLDPHSQKIIGVFLTCSLIMIMVAMFFGGALSVSGANATRVKQGSQEYQQLYNIVEEMKIASSMQFMPKIYVLDVDYYNAFASGWSEKNAVVAVSKPLLGLLSREELQAVIAHELSHIKHQDTRVLTLVMVCANILVSVIDALARSVLYDNRKSHNKKDSGGLVLLVIMVVRIILPILSAFMLMYVSRKREYLADAGCVGMTRNARALGTALIKIENAHKDNLPKAKEAYRNTSNEGLRSLSYIYAPSQCGISGLYDVNMWFSTHPSLSKRLKALGLKDLLKQN